MAKLRKFPDSWVHISEKEQQEYIEYLLQHYMDYKVKFLDNDHVRVGKDVNIHQFNFRSLIDNKMVSAYVINHVILYDNEPNAVMLKKLFESCKDIAKQNDEFIKNLKFFAYAFCVSIPVMLCIGIALNINADKKEKKIEEQVKQYEQSLPNYNEYLQTKQQIEHYRDSLIHTRTK